MYIKQNIYQGYFNHRTVKEYRLSRVMLCYCHVRHLMAAVLLNSVSRDGYFFYGVISWLHLLNTIAVDLPPLRNMHGISSNYTHHV